MNDNAESSKKPVEKGESPSRTGLRGGLLFLGWAVLIGTLLALVAAWGARLDWRLDLASHFPLQRAIAFAAAGCLLSAARSYRSAAFASVCFALQLSALVPFWLPTGATRAEGRVYRGLTVNLLASNGNPDPTIAYLREAKADFVGLQELTPAWSEEFNALKREYPYSALYPREGAFGIGFVSRRPIVSQKPIVFVDTDYPSLEVRIARDEGEATVIVTHPPPPVSRKQAKTRNNHFAALAEHVRDIEGPVIVVGDLNATPWSPYFQDLLEASELSDGRLGQGVEATWPAKLGPIGIPIDHVLVTPDVDVVEFEAGPALGSDHRPVAFAFRIASPHASE